MKYVSIAHRQIGLTLVELIVALGIIAALGVLSFRALSAASTSQSHLDDGFVRWSALDRSLSRVETELLEIAKPPPVSASTPVKALQFVGKGDGVSSELCFLRLDAGLGARRVGFRLREQKLEWLLWDGREAVGLPQVEILLENVGDLRWGFIDGGRYVEDWAPDTEHIGRLPAGVVVEIDLPDLGSFYRIFALR